MIRGLSLLTVVVVATACSGPIDPERIVVASIEDRPVTLAEFESYLESNLAADAPELPEEERSLVHSRLFDAFLEERVLRAAAEKRRVSADFLEDEARRIALEQRPLSAEEVRAYLEEHRDRLLGGRRLTLRVLLFDTEKEARRAHREIRRRRLTFDEAVAANRTGPGQGLPVTVVWEDLGKEVRSALKGLGPGQVSAPVQTNGQIYLFRIEPEGAEDRPDERALLDEARRQLEKQRRRAAVRELVERARRETRLRVRTSNLPFRYVAPRAPQGRG